MCCSQEDAGKERSPGVFQDSDAKAEVCDTRAWSLIQLQVPAALSSPLISPAPAYLWPPSSGTIGSGTRIEVNCLPLTFLAACYQS